MRAGVEGASSVSGLRTGAGPLVYGPEADDSLRAGDMPPAYVESLRAILMRKWWILGFAAFVVSLAAAYVWRQPLVFRAGATLLIESSKANVVAIQEVSADSTAQREHFQTQVEQLKSRPVAQLAIARLGLLNHPEFDPRQGKPSRMEAFVLEFAPWLAQYWAKPAAPLDREQVEASVLRSFATRVSVEPVKLSQLVRVSFDSTDPVLAARAANALCEAFIQVDIDERLGISKRAGTWVNQELNELKQKLDASERALQSFREREGLLSSSTVNLNGSVIELENLTRKLVEVRSRRVLLQSDFGQIAAAGAGRVGDNSLPAVLRHPGVQRAQEVESAAEKRVLEYRQRFGPDHPRLVSAEYELRSARSSLAQQRQAVVDSVEREYKAALATERTIEEALARSKSDIQVMSRKEGALRELEREVATNRQIHQTFLSRQKEIGTNSETQRASARLIDPAFPPVQAARPNKRQTVLLALGLSLLLGAFAALLHRQLYNRVDTRDDVDLKLYQPLLAALPLLSRKLRRLPAMLVVHRPDEVFAEGIRTVCTGLLLSNLEASHKVIAVCSSVPGEGKSTVACNVALNLSRTRRTLLIEADMRRPSVGTALGIDAKQLGLSDLVAGMAEQDECIFKYSRWDLNVMTAGTLPPNPLDLLSSRRFGDVVQGLQGQYDFVIIDCPPLQLVSDALVVGRYVTGLVYVVKASDTPVATVKSGLKRLFAARVPVLGVVLNHLDYKRAERYYGDYGGYDSGKHGKYSKGGYGYGVQA